VSAAGSSCKRGWLQLENAASREERDNQALQVARSALDETIKANESVERANEIAERGVEAATRSAKLRRSRLDGSNGLRSSPR
jgi:hypothetical protein